MGFGGKGKAMVAYPKGWAGKGNNYNHYGPIPAWGGKGKAQPAWSAPMGVKGAFQKKMPSVKGNSALAGEEGRKCFVGQLPFSKSEGDLRQLFSQCGSVLEVALMRNSATGEKTGAGFVVFAMRGSAEAAVRSLNNYTFPGATRPITVSIAQSNRFRVFVGRLPFSKSEGDLRQLFSSCGKVLEVALLRKASTGEKKGAGFVVFDNEGSATQAVNTYNEYTFPGATRPITVSYAQQSSGAEEGVWGQASVGGGHVEGAKLFVGQLPFSKSEMDLVKLFSQYGSVADVTLFRDQMGQKKGAGFLSFRQPHEAHQALGLNGYMFEGATRPISVSLAGQKVRF